MENMYKLSIFSMSTFNLGDQASYKRFTDSKRRKATIIGVSKVDKYSMDFFQKPKVFMNVIPSNTRSNALV